MTDLNEWLKERRTIHNAATEGPWESGNWYHVQGESHCTCRSEYGPLVGIDPEGAFGRMHIHRRPEPAWEDGVRARDDSTGGFEVVIDTSEYGGTSEGDRAAIVDAHNTLPAALTAIEKVLEVISKIDREHSKAPGDDAYADGMCDAAYMFDTALSEAIEGAINE